MIDPGLAVGRVEEHIGEPLIGQRPVPEGAHLGVQVSADTGDLVFGDRRIGAQRFDQIINLAGGGAVQIGLHHHREQALIDPAAPLQQRREKRTGPQLGDPQLEIPGDRGQRSRSRSVALVRP